MWVEELRLENVKCFDGTTVRFAERDRGRQWVTFLGENGGGKSTALQAMGLLLAGPEGIAAKAAGDTRTPLELLDEIEARGHEVDEAVARLRALLTNGEPDRADPDRRASASVVVCRRSPVVARLRYRT